MWLVDTYPLIFEKPVEPQEENNFFCSHKTNGTIT